MYACLCVQMITEVAHMSLIASTVSYLLFTQSQQPVRGMLLCMGEEVLDALHLRQSADGAVLAEALECSGSST